MATLYFRKFRWTYGEPENHIVLLTGKSMEMGNPRKVFGTLGQNSGTNSDFWQNFAYKAQLIFEIPCTGQI